MRSSKALWMVVLAAFLLNSVACSSYGRVDPGEFPRRAPDPETQFRITTARGEVHELVRIRWSPGVLVGQPVGRDHERVELSVADIKTLEKWGFSPLRTAAFVGGSVAVLFIGAGVLVFLVAGEDSCGSC